MNGANPLYGLLVEFRSPETLIAATLQVRDRGYRNIDAFTPYPVEGISEVLGLKESRLPLIVFLGGLFGGGLGYSLQYYLAAINYPLDVGGRPLHSWAPFLVITFELTILGAALSAVIGMLALNGLPMPYHPVFNSPRFALASRDRFFLVVETRDPLFDRRGTREFLESLQQEGVSEIAS